jgi:pSer/pThr/pTyr-binding forkhead associated (FHA) protein
MIKGSWYQRLLMGQSDTATGSMAHVSKSVKFLDGTPKAIKLLAEKIRVGRNHINEVVLDDKGVSRFHCEITKKGKGPFAKYYIRDTGSSTGTFIKRGKKIIIIGKNPLSGQEDFSEVELKYGDRIRLNETEFLVKIMLF